MSESSRSRWSTCIMVLFTIRRTVESEKALAKPMRNGWPARLASPKTLPSSKIPMVASFPLFDTTVSLTLPFFKWNSASLRSPWVKMRLPARRSKVSALPRSSQGSPRIKTALLSCATRIGQGGVCLILLVDVFQSIAPKLPGSAPNQELGRKTPKRSRQCVPHPQAGAGESRLHTGFANAERLYRFGDTELLHVPQYEHGTIFLRE